MSCRVIRDHHQPAAEPLFMAPPRPKVQQEYPRWAGQEEAAKQLAEAATLQSRVRELEAALTAKVAEARTAGQREGETAGFERASAAGKPVMKKLANSIADIAGLRARVREETESDLIALSIAIARRILRRELSVDPDAIQGLVKAALERIGSREITRVRIFPSHESAVRHCLAAQHAMGVELVSDPGMQPGDVVIETRRGNLEASIETQLAEIERGFADRIGK